MHIGIDLGGTKIEIVAMDDTGRIHLRQRRPTPQGKYDATLEAIVELVMATEKMLGQTATVGIGTPGSLSAHTGLMRNSNSTCLNGRPLAADLERALARPVRLANDANCFALSESRDGAAAGAHCVFGVILGTGTGAGVVVGGELLNGRNHIAGEWGHNPLPWPTVAELPGPECYCGKRGCIETYLSGPGFSAQHFIVTGERLPAHEIVAQAEQGDAASRNSLDIYLQRLARSLAHVINLLDPDVIVLGGGMSNIEQIYAQVPLLWQQWVFSERVETHLLRARFGDSSGVRGAAWLWGPVTGVAGAQVHGDHV